MDYLERIKSLDSAWGRSGRDPRFARELIAKERVCLVMDYREKADRLAKMAEEHDRQALALREQADAVETAGQIYKACLIGSPVFEPVKNEDWKFPRFRPSHVDQYMKRFVKRARSESNA